MPFTCSTTPTIWAIARFSKRLSAEVENYHIECKLENKLHSYSQRNPDLRCHVTFTVNGIVPVIKHGYRGYLRAEQCWRRKAFGFTVSYSVLVADCDLSELLDYVAETKKLNVTSRKNMRSTYISSLGRANQNYF